MGKGLFADRASNVAVTRLITSRRTSRKLHRSVKELDVSRILMGNPSASSGGDSMASGEKKVIGTPLRFWEESSRLEIKSLLDKNLKRHARLQVSRQRFEFKANDRNPSGWWAVQELNLRPHACRACALAI